MARIQILELPEGAGDDRPPFAVIIDQHEPQRYLLGADQQPPPSPWDGMAEQLGARAVLVFEDTIDIPANEVTLASDETGSTVRVRLEPDFTGWDDALTTALARVQEAVADQLTLKLGDKDASPTLGNVRHGIDYAKQQHGADGPTCRYCGADCSNGRSWDGGDLYACPACSDWRAKLNKHKAALTDALGMDRLRDWDDIRNAATGIRKERDALFAASERVRQLHSPAEHKGQTICTECSGYDGSTGTTTDNAPVAHPCTTTHALTTGPAQPNEKAQHHIGAPERCCDPAFRTLGREHADDCDGPTTDG